MELYCAQRVKLLKPTVLKKTKQNIISVICHNERLTGFVQKNKNKHLSVKNLVHYKNIFYLLPYFSNRHRYSYSQLHFKNKK